MLLRFVLIMFFIFSVASPAFAGFDEGKKAYDSKDWPKALAELKPLADKGDDKAMLLLGNIYSDGDGVPADYKKALEFYEHSAEKNNPIAMLAAAAMYANGIGAEKNTDKANRWFRTAAETGDQTGAFFYAQSFINDNPNPDFYSSYKWFLIASQRGENKQLQEAAKDLAERIARARLTSTEMLKAGKEAKEWQPPAKKS